jgi:ABC-type branched-subunit amino acid transport system substrate-binding protein
MRLVALCFAMFAASAQAQWLIGQTSSFTGPSAGAVAENTAGAKLYFDAVNQRGGVHGKKIELISVDDKWDAKLAVVNARELIVDRKVLALFLNRSTNLTEAILPVLEEHGVALVGPTSGAGFLHQPLRRFVFNVRAPFRKEAQKAVIHLASVNVQRIGVFHANDAFGSDAVQGAQDGFNVSKTKPKFIEVYDRKSPDPKAMAAKVVKEDLQAVLLLGPSEVVAQTTAAIRTSGSLAQIVTLSNNASSSFVDEMGKYASGTIVTQVFPSERNVAVGLVREAATLARPKNVELSPSVLEGFAAAKVLVEGLRRAGPTATRERLVQALETMTNFDLGGLPLNYSPTDHSGLDFVDISILTPDGRFRR